MDSTQTILAIQRIGDRHHSDRHSPKDPAIGCPWCISDDREELIMNLIDGFNTDLWKASAHTGRWVAAGLDLWAYAGGSDG